MTTNSLAGFRAVYVFSLKEHVKGVPFRVMSVLICLALLVIMPLIYWAIQSESLSAVQLTFQKEFVFMLLISGIIACFVAVSGEGIASSVVAEKSSRMMEYLMTTVKPLSLILGKVLACITAVFSQLVMMAASTFLGWKIAFWMSGRTLTLNALLRLLSGEVRIQPLGVVFAVLMFLFSLLMFGLFSGIIGAAVTRLEDTAEGLQIFNIVLAAASIFGVWCAKAGTEAGAGFPVYFAIFCPLTSPFIVPAYLALGHIAPWMAALSFTILLATILVLAKLTAAVYETMVYYRGEALSVRHVLERFAPKGNLAPKGDLAPKEGLR